VTTRISLKQNLRNISARQSSALITQHGVIDLLHFADGAVSFDNVYGVYCIIVLTSHQH
jgi:hypothetical protein